MTHDTGKEFMRMTQYKHMEPSEQKQGLPQPPLEAPYDETQPLIDLPTPDNMVLEPHDLLDLITRRVSIRNYADASLTLDELSYLLWCTQGIKPDNTRPDITKRTVPSAGARHAFETILLVNNVAGLEPGLYRFVASRHKLLALEAVEDIGAELAHVCLRQAHIRHSAVTFFWIAVAERMVYRYGARGFRYLHLDAGHVCQNLYLAAEAIDCGVCAIAAFEDDALNELLDLDGEDQFAIYLATLGRKP